MLKIEQISAYLPYKLTCLVDDKFKAQLNSVYSDGSCTFCDLIESDKGFSSIKPILKSISDADTLIRTEFYRYESNKEFDKNIIDLFCFEFIGTEELLSEIELSNLPYKSMQWLLSNHFDVFGLLDSGDAVLA